MKRLLFLAGYVIYRLPHLPKGADVFQSLRSHWPDWRPTVIFDVGANIGQTVNRLRPLFPAARIVCFEPGSSACKELQRHTASDTLVHVVQTALGETEGNAILHLHQIDDQNSLIEAAVTDAGHAASSESVRLETLDAYCRHEKIQRIDLLKIDVEGYELAVLRGAETLLRNHAVDYIVAEAGLMPGNPRFTPLHLLVAHLAAHDFWLIGVYEQYGACHAQTAEFCNALFARRALLQDATRPSI